MKRLRVGIIYGGRSGEHEVSLASAAAVFTNLDRTRYEPIPLRIEKDGVDLYPRLDCSWVQAMENSADPAHLQILHQGAAFGGRVPPNTTRGFTDDVEAFAQKLGKVDVTIGDRAGFIANALLFGYLNHAAEMY